MAKDPAFLFYPNDWMGGTMGMTFEEKGAYMELLMLQFNRGHMTYDMIGLTVGQTFGRIKDKFKQDSDGLWYNERLELEKNKRKEYVNSRYNNKAGGNQYTKKKDNKSGHMTYHMEDVNENINNTLLNKEKEGFEKNKNDEEMIVTEMNKIWVKYKPKYVFFKKVDYPAYLQIAYTIAEIKEINKADVVGTAETEVLAEFDKIAKFLSLTDSKFFCSLTVDSISLPKNLQKIEEAMRIEKEPVKNKKSNSGSLSMGFIEVPKNQDYEHTKGGW